MNKFTVYWHKDGVSGKNVIYQEKIANVMASLKDAFNKNNEISTKMLEVLPKVTSMRIDFDRNESMDIPFVQYTTKSGSHIIEIRRCHKIIWSILEGLCK